MVFISYPTLYKGFDAAYSLAIHDNN